ncbi:peptidoglycan DD-metalloendopeptidase family protein [Robertmurraya andreesenii]|uniref:LysM repeat protein n=1 Tax=Anoxybacillus andreesenii TaxID=1325932 RepID=A0ABT9V8C1_9BACL|nr:peptidoglycan DD-metalloendopeptidase family protein [Robertmurraya andreesenii]MDQ0157206.1 LysM repeat protein [Robertmurraya andreesenii]
MKDFLKRLLIVGIMAIFISLLFIGVKYPQAETNTTAHWMWPTDGVVTDTFGTRHGRHYGIDIAGGYGTPVYSVDAGVVTKSYFSSSYGNVVFVKHPNNLETVYAHLSKRQVKEGQVVEQGSIIGEMGTTGRSSGVHLHFEVHKKEWTVSKENALNPGEILGYIEVGENVQAMQGNKGYEQVAGIMETASSINNEISRYLLDSDYELIAPQLDEEENKPSVEQTEEKMELGKTVYRVKKGDTLWAIAQKYKTTVQEIKSLNQLKSDLIFPEQNLTVGFHQAKTYQ